MKTLYLAWQDPEDRRWLPVGRLSFDGHVYRFVYTKGAEQSPRFVPFGAMRDLYVVYESSVLFPLFANRLLSKTRPEYKDFLSWLDVREHEDAPLVLLARTEGMRATDTLMVFPCPEKSSDGKYQVRFFSHGLRYVLPAVIEFIDNDLRPSAQLFLMLDSQNPHDPAAVALRTAAPALLVGYCPRFLTADVHHLLQTVPATVHVAVERVNRDAPLQLRLLCSLIADWPDNFQPCSDALYETLA
jgi:HIRAN domain-containing protein